MKNETSELADAAIEVITQLRNLSIKLAHEDVDKITVLADACRRAGADLTADFINDEPPLTQAVELMHSGIALAFYKDHAITLQAGNSKTITIPLDLFDPAFDQHEQYWGTESYPYPKPTLHIVPDEFTANMARDYESSNRW